MCFCYELFTVRFYKDAGNYVGSCDLLQLGYLAVHVSAESVPASDGVYEAVAGG